MPIEGGAITIAAAAIHQIPFYVKEASFIISNSNLTSMNNTTITKVELLVIYYYDKLPSTYNLFEDDGISKMLLKTIDTR